MEDLHPQPAGPPMAAGVTGESSPAENPGRLRGEPEHAGLAGQPGDAGVGRESAGAVEPGAPAVPSAVYWRRRAVALAVGIGLLTILVWAVNGTLGSGATAPPGGHAAGSSSGHGHGGPGGSGHGGTGSGGAQGGAHGGAGGGVGGHPAAPAGTAAAAGPGTASASPPAGVPASASGSPSAAPPGSPSPGSPSPGSPSPGSTATPGADRVPACGPGDVALSLSTPKYWYERGQLPEFVVAAASASGRPCRFNMGARYVAVVVNYGMERIWSSADCARSAGSRGVVLTREHPAIAWITWNRRTSVPGCRPAGHTVKGATYTVTAVSGRLRSQGMVIVLDAPGLSVP